MRNKGVGQGLESLRHPGTETGFALVLRQARVKAWSGGCCGDPIGDTHEVIPFRRMPQNAPLSPDAPNVRIMEELPVKDKRKRKSTAKRRRKRSQPLEQINMNAAGVDCGSEYHHVAVPADRDANPVRRFRTFTADLRALADWLVECGIETVAMEATGVYWIPLYEILEERGLEAVLVNAHHVKNVPGRKTDVVDCQWIQELHSFGLLRGGFRPSREIASLRAYLRHRDKLVLGAGDHVRRMQKALVEMNLQLHTVISDITGKTGMRILRDIVAGVHDPKVLAAHRDSRCRATEAEVEASLTGNYRPEYLFALRQNLELYDAHVRQIESCDHEIEALLQHMASHSEQPETPLPPARHRYYPRGLGPKFDPRELLYRLTSADLTQIPSIGPYAALRLISEIGTDMTRWPTERQFTSWLTLAPNNKISGGKLLSSKTKPSANRAAVVLRMSAVTVGRTSTALGAYYRRMAYRVSNPKAVTATARKLATFVYRVLRGDIQYADPGADAYDARHRQRIVARLRKRAQNLGLALIDPDSGELVGSVVS